VGPDDADDAAAAEAADITKAWAPANPPSRALSLLAPTVCTSLARARLPAVEDDGDRDVDRIGVELPVRGEGAGDAELCNSAKAGAAPTAVECCTGGSKVGAGAGIWIAVGAGSVVKGGVGVES
jgi:hypothetical protein